MSLSPEVAAAFWWPGPAPSPSPFPLLCSPVSFIHNPQERGQGRGREGLSPGSGRGRGPGAPLTAEASLTHPATHVSLYGQGFLSVLKGNCEKSRADSGCLAVSWQQAWQEVFLSPPPPHLPSFLHRPPLSLPPCVLCCVSLKLPSQPLRSQQPGPSGASSFGAAQPAGPGGGGLRGVKPPETGFVCWNQGLNSVWQPSAHSRGAATRTAPSLATSSVSPPLPFRSQSLLLVPIVALGTAQPCQGLRNHSPPGRKNLLWRLGQPEPGPAASSGPGSWSGLEGAGTQRVEGPSNP